MTLRVDVAQHLEAARVALVADAAVTLQCRPSAAEPSGTRPWMPGSGCEPDRQSARGVASSGGSALRWIGALAGVCPVPWPSAPRSLICVTGVWASPCATSASVPASSSTTRASTHEAVRPRITFRPAPPSLTQVMLLPGWRDGAGNGWPACHHCGRRLAQSGSRSGRLQQMNHGHDSHGHGHSHGLVDDSIKRSREGVRAVALSLLVLTLTAFAQVAIYLATSSVALLADLVHNFGDALTALPLGAAFLLRSRNGERWAGFAVVFAIFVSACVAAFEAVSRLVHPQSIDHLGALAAAGVIGFLGNEIAARVRTRAGRRLDSPALIADGDHARADGIVSLAVVASAVVVAVGVPVADPIIGLVISLAILRITWHSWQTVRAGHDHDHDHDHSESHGAVNTAGANR